MLFHYSLSLSNIVQYTQFNTTQLVRSKWHKMSWPTTVLFGFPKYQENSFQYTIRCYKSIIKKFVTFHMTTIKISLVFSSLSLEKTNFTHC